MGELWLWTCLLCFVNLKIVFLIYVQYYVRIAFVFFFAGGFIIFKQRSFTSKKLQILRMLCNFARWPGKSFARELESCFLRSPLLTRIRANKYQHMPFVRDKIVNVPMAITVKASIDTFGACIHTCPTSPQKTRLSMTILQDFPVTGPS